MIMQKYTLALGGHLIITSERLIDAHRQAPAETKRKDRQRNAKSCSKQENTNSLWHVLVFFTTRGRKSVP